MDGPRRAEPQEIGVRNAERAQHLARVLAQQGRAETRRLNGRAVDAHGAGQHLDGRTVFRDLEGYVEWEQAFAGFDAPLELVRSIREVAADPKAAANGYTAP